jgi:hypothetical protein
MVMFMCLNSFARTTRCIGEKMLYIKLFFRDQKLVHIFTAVATVTVWVMFNDALAARIVFLLSGIYLILAAMESHTLKPWKFSYQATFALSHIYAWASFLAYLTFMKGGWMKEEIVLCLFPFILALAFAWWGGWKYHDFKYGHNQGFRV